MKGRHPGKLKFSWPDQITLPEIFDKNHRIMGFSRCGLLMPAATF